MIDTNLEIDGRKVYVTPAGLFSVKVGGEVLTSVRFDRLEREIEAHLAEIAEKQERQRRAAQRRASAGAIPVWVRENTWGRLVPATYRGRHATTGATLLTLADGTKPVGKKFYTLYADLTKEQVDEVNGLRERTIEIDNLIDASKEKAIQKGRLSAYTKEGWVTVVHDKYGRNRKDVAEFTFTASGQYLSVDIGDTVLSAESAHDLEEAVVRRLHPDYGKQVWIIDIRNMALRDQPEVFLGDVRAHFAEENFYSSDALAYVDRADAEEFLRLKALRSEVGDQFKQALDALPKLLDDGDED